MSQAQWSTARFGEADLELEHFGGPEPPRPSYPPDDAGGGWEHSGSDVFALSVPPGQLPSQNLPDSIEAAVLAAIEQIPRAPSAPELPAWAYRKPR